MQGGLCKQPVPGRKFKGFLIKVLTNGVTHLLDPIYYLSGHYTLYEVGNGFGVSYATVSRAVKLFEKSNSKFDM